MRTNATTIAARIRAIAPHADHSDLQTPAGAALFDLDRIASGTWDGDEQQAAEAIEMAIEATAEYTEDGFADPEALQ